jgi:hypothetical protein
LAVIPTNGDPDSTEKDTEAEVNVEATGGSLKPNGHEPSASVLSTALEYIAQGFAVVPVGKGTKRPAAGGRWNDLRISPKSASAYFNSDTNIGFLCGEPSGWKIDIDIDAVGALPLADRFLPATGLIFGRK